MANIQYRGHCQCCGREQAVVGVFMSKHGYTVSQGWFQGVCHGDGYAPIEVSREHADWTVARVRSDVESLKVDLEDMKAGKITPKTVRGNYNIATRGYDEIAFPDAPAYAQREAVKSLIWNTEQRIRFCAFSPVSDQNCGSFAAP